MEIFIHCYNIYIICYVVSMQGNGEPSKQCDMPASTEVSTAAPVGGAIPSTSTKEYLTDEELYCDESQPPVVCIY